MRSQAANTGRIDVEAGSSEEKSLSMYREARPVWTRREFFPYLVITGLILFIVWGTDASFLSTIKHHSSGLLQKGYDLSSSEDLQGSQAFTAAEFYTFTRAELQKLQAGMASMLTTLDARSIGGERARATTSPSASTIQEKTKAAYKRMIERRDAAYGSSLPSDETQAYFYFTPSYSCPFEERIGDLRDGGKWICDPTSLNNQSIVYSVGSNAEVSFETQLHQLCNGCKIHVFDMTIDEPRMQPIRDAEAAGVMTFHPIGFGVSNNAELHIKPLQDIMAELNHTFIDIFKIDCEGCEWDFFENILKAFPPALFGQVLVELHPFFDKDRSNKFFKFMEEKGYLIFHYETNAIWRLGIEVAFIHKSIVNIERRR